MILFPNDDLELVIELLYAGEIDVLDHIILSPINVVDNCVEQFSSKAYVTPPVLIIKSSRYVVAMYVLAKRYSPE